MVFFKKLIDKIVLKYLFLILFFVFFCGLTYRLLFLEQISGTEFVALIIAIMFACLIMNFLNEIQELSIGGNLLKLKEAKGEVNEAIEQLKLFRLETFRIFLSRAAEFPGGWGVLGFNDERAEKFINLIEQIKIAGVFDELKQEIKSKSILIIEAHLRKVLSIDPSGELKKKLLNTNDILPNEKHILLAIKDHYFDDSVVQLNWERVRVEKEFNRALDNYTALLDIKKKSE